MEILPAQPGDHDAIVALFKEYGFALQEKSWWDWKYDANPHGAAKSFKIVQDGELVGAVAIMPQKFRHGDREVTGLQTVDGLMGREIRGKHLFNDVMAFLLRNRPGQVEDDYFYLSFPSLTSSVRAHQNAGWVRLADGMVYTFPLAPGAVLRGAGLGWLRALTAPVWALYRGLLGQTADRGVSVRAIDRFTDDDVPELPADKVRGDRSAEMLNWRVFANPRDDMLAYRVEDEGRLAGCFVLKMTGGGAEIVDGLFARPRSAYLIALLQEIRRTRLADSVDLLVFGNHPNRALLPSSGYIRRDFSGVAFVNDVTTAGLPPDPGQWEISYLDSDW